MPVASPKVQNTQDTSPPPNSSEVTDEKYPIARRSIGKPNASHSLPFSEVTNNVSGNRVLQGTNFCLHMGCPPPAEILAALWPGWVIGRMSEGMASSFCQENRFAACSEDKSFTRAKAFHLQKSPNYHISTALADNEDDCFIHFVKAEVKKGHSKMVPS
ncbi:hypothetical protein CB1_000667035 [Camelus ferus]|nr:hypothetical protein CB1_000667035 [Camelus ferus]